MTPCLRRRLMFGVCSPINSGVSPATSRTTVRRIVLLPTHHRLRTEHGFSVHATWHAPCLSRDVLGIPRHVAIIMDGNGRWARSRGLERLEGHAQGLRAVRASVVAASRIGVEYLTLYAFSIANWSRP